MKLGVSSYPNIASNSVCSLIILLMLQPVDITICQLIKYNIPMVPCIDVSKPQSQLNIYIFSDYLFYATVQTGYIKIHHIH